MKRAFFIILGLLCSLSLTIKGEGLRVLFIGDSITDGGWGNSGGSANIVRHLATDYETTLVPFDSLFAQLLREHPVNNGRHWVWDGIHPTPAGHRRMADLWIEQTGELLIFN